MIADLSFNIGGSEWVVIILLGLFLLFGAKKMPEVSKTLGRVIGQYQRAKNTIQEEITNSVKPFTTPPKFDMTSRTAATTTTTPKTEEQTSAEGTNADAAANTVPKPETVPDANLSGPVVTEREKLEIIARTLDIEPRGKSTDELRQLISSKMNQ